MNILDLLIPQTMERQRARARQSFQAGLQQPQVFNTEEFPLEALQKNYEKGYGLPYPTRQAPSPTAPIEGMTTDPNRQTTVAPANMPIELVAPRTLEQRSMRAAGIEGQSAAEKDLSALQYYGEQKPRMEGFFEDVGEDIGEYDIPASVGGFQRQPQAQTAEPGESYGNLVWDPKIGSYRQQELASGKWGTVGKAPSPGSGQDPYDDIYQDALNTYKAIIAKAKIDPAQAMLLTMIPPEKSQPLVEGLVTPHLTPDERRQLEQAIQIMDKIQQVRRSGLNLGQLPMEQDQQDAATAEGFLKRHMGQ